MHQVHRLLKNKNMKIQIIVGFFILSALVWLGFAINGHYHVSTDDAYINANVVRIAPRVTGKVIKLHIKNNQFVEKGQVLFDLDPEPFQVAIDAAQAQLMLSEAELTNANMNEKRTLTLVQKHYVSPQGGDDVIASYKIALAKVEANKAALQQANLNMRYTHVTAPTSGWVANVSTREGDMVAANQPLFALISHEEFWADANFKETEMEHIKPGQTATIVTDLYPNHTFHGYVESISGGAGAAFSLLPPQNATGNWVKVTQRVPVRVAITDHDPAYPLRIGISADVTINLQDYVKNAQP